jgi:hypothetical protein
MQPVIPVIQKLEQLVKDSCIEPNVREELLRFVKEARTAAEANDASGVVNHIDLFVLAVQRNMGAEISLRRALELVDVAVMDVKRHVGDLAQIFAEAQAFGLTFIRMASGTDLPLNLVSRPIPPGVQQTQRAMEKAIRSYSLPLQTEKTLVKLVDRMTKLALASMPGPLKPEEELQFVETLIDSHDQLTALEGRYITTTQKNFLMGMVVFDHPWLCVVPVAWIVQAGIVILALILLGIYYVFRSTEAQRAAKGLSDFIGECTHTEREVTDKTKEVIKDLSDEDKKDIKKAFEKARDEGEAAGTTPRSKKLRAKLQAAINELPK